MLGSWAILAPPDQSLGRKQVLHLAATEAKFVLKAEAFQLSRILNEMQDRSSL